jgi:hypothetical protein
LAYSDQVATVANGTARTGIMRTNRDIVH